MTAREIARAALDLADEALALAERKDSCTGGQRRVLAALEAADAGPGPALFSATTVNV